jgi:hypothetical protein
LILRSWHHSFALKPPAALYDAAYSTVYPSGNFGLSFLQQNESRVADSKLAAAIVRDLQKHL